MIRTLFTYLTVLTLVFTTFNSFAGGGAAAGAATAAINANQQKQAAEEPSVIQQATTTVKEAATTAKQTVATNLNDVVIDILRSGKLAAGEVYAASKTAITKSVDFTMEQAPLVVKEFLTWKLAEAIINIIIWTTPAFVLFYLARVLRKRSENAGIPECSNAMLLDREGSRAFKWIFRVFGIIIIMANLGTNGMTITKIAVAPRVYLIEYVVDAIQQQTVHPTQLN